MTSTAVVSTHVRRRQHDAEEKPFSFGCVAGAPRWVCVLLSLVAKHAVARQILGGSPASSSPPRAWPMTVRS